MPIAKEVLEAQARTNDLEFFKERVKTMPLLIEWANDEIRNNKEVLLTAVKIDGGALEFASDNLKNDKDVLLEAVSQAAWTGCYASERLRDDKDVILTGAKTDGQILYLSLIHI